MRSNILAVLNLLKFKDSFEIEARLEVEYKAKKRVDLAAPYDLNSGDRIFPGNTKHILQHEMQRGCAASGGKRIQIHDLRHSHASLLIEMGYSPLLIAERLGHENIETTLQTYSHLYPNKQGQLVTELKKMQKCYDFAADESRR